LGDGSDEESGSEEDDDDDDDEEGWRFALELSNIADFSTVADASQAIQDRTETNLVNLRRIIYLTIMNALNYEEAVHKLLKVQLQEGQEVIPIVFIMIED
jgi:pre-mRNA-splicing factor CWC22